MAALSMPSLFLLSLLIAAAAAAAAVPAHYLPAPVPAPAHQPPAPVPAPAHQPPAPEPAPAHQPHAPEPAPAHQPPAPVPAPAHQPPAPEPAPAHQPPPPAPVPAYQPPPPEPAPAHQPPPPAPAPAYQPPGNIHINGTVPCGVGPMIPPVFPNARVLLQCVGQVICNTTSDANGVFAMDVSSDSSKLLSRKLLELLKQLELCKLKILTPLSACNPALPTTGHLQSSLNLLSDVTTGFPINCIPGKFFVGP